MAELYIRTLPTPLQSDIGVDVADYTNRPCDILWPYQPNYRGHYVRAHPCCDHPVTPSSRLIQPSVHLSLTHSRNVGAWGNYYSQHTHARTQTHTHTDNMNAGCRGRYSGLAMLAEQEIQKCLHCTEGWWGDIKASLYKWILKFSSGTPPECD